MKDIRQSKATKQPKKENKREWSFEKRVQHKVQVVRCACWHVHYTNVAYLYELFHLHSYPLRTLTVLLLTQAEGFKWSHSEREKQQQTFEDSPLSSCECRKYKNSFSRQGNIIVQFLEDGWGEKSHREAGRRISAHLENRLHGTMITLSLTLSLFPLHD